jgi:hypothetical protein
VSVLSEYTERSADGETRGEERVCVEKLLGRLNGRERAVVVLRFREDLSYREIGERVGNVSRERVRQIEAKALRAMRRPGAAQKPPAPYTLTTPLTESERAAREKERQRELERRRLARKKEWERQQRAARKRLSKERKASQEYWHRMNVAGYVPDDFVRWLATLPCVSEVTFTSPKGAVDRLTFFFEGEQHVYSHAARPKLYQSVWELLHPVLSEEENKHMRSLLDVYHPFISLVS